MGEIVKYHNDVHSASLRKFNAVELDIFMAILTRMRDKDEEEIVFSFDELKGLIKWTGKNDREFASMLDSMYKKLIECNIKLETEEQLVRFVLFTRYAISKARAEIAIKVSADFKLVLNSLLNHFTRFELDEFISLKSSYTKEFYRRMKQFRNTGAWIVSLQEFKRVLDIPEKYDVDAINKRVLDPILEELGSKYQLTITKQYDRTGRGRPSVSGFKFTFLRDSELAREARDVAQTVDVEAKEALASSVDAEVKDKEVSRARNREKNPTPDAEFYGDRYIGRTIRMKDQRFDKYNYLKLKAIAHNPEDGTVQAEVQNIDDGYENMLFFETVKSWENFFNKYLI